MFRHKENDLLSPGFGGRGTESLRSKDLFEKGSSFVSDPETDKVKNIRDFDLHVPWGVPRAVCLWERRGRGKSLMAVFFAWMLAQDAAAKGIKYNVYSNIDVNFATISDPFIYDTFEKLGLEGPGVVIFDEVTQHANSKRVMSTTALGIENAFKFMRKQELDVIMTDQSPQAIPRNIQQQVDFFVRPRLFEAKEYVEDGLRRRFMTWVTARTEWLDWKGDITGRDLSAKGGFSLKEADPDKTIFYSGVEQMYNLYDTKEKVYSPHSERGKAIYANMQKQRDALDAQFFQGVEHVPHSVVRDFVDQLVRADTKDTGMSDIDIAVEVARTIDGMPLELRGDFWHRDWHGPCSECGEKDTGEES